MYHLQYMLNGVTKLIRNSEHLPLVPRFEESVALEDGKIYKVMHVGYTYKNDDTHVIISLKEYK